MAGEKILVVEDSDTKRAIYADVLQDKGYLVLQAKDGEEGLKIAQEDNPDIIVTDISMPKMDGFQMVQRLKSDEKTKYIPIICISATYQDLASKMKALTEAGAEEYFYAVQHAEELLAKVAVMLRIRAIYLDLLKKNVQLEKINHLAVDRELKMIELKKKIKLLEEELQKYKGG
mgnify:CR=1 FL=1